MLRRLLRPLLRPLALAFCLLALTIPPAAAKPLTVLLDWFVNPDHGPLVVAQEAGYFAEAGLEVELIAPADPNDPPKLVAAEKAEVAVTYQPQVHMQAAAGLPLVRIATLVATPLNSVVVLDEGPIKTLADLKGRKIGYSVGGFEDALLGTMLASHGVKLDEVELINVNFALSPSIVAGKVDATIGAFRNFELNQMDINGTPGRAFYPEEHGVPAYDELVLVAHRDHLDDPRLPKLVAAIGRATRHMVNHPEESWEMFAQAYPDLNDELNRRAWADTLPRFALRPAALDTTRYETFGAFLKEQGLIDTVPPLDTYARQID
ncbi:ABC transporter substrate-binding protein [Roseospirillum parvum]|uniref:Putative hydroxymethylpyrimidine transport system substrate-binding protein n=1 Tax=Roseospirillum parvum TaxID=83401 RepID=A0A1G8B721_9PROT|nr:ABC transporter substrate-binding protein [Roseospirillum parvum]SDH28997.1 putative hydroxymethylpyrimidine transport system substrate-binding protein [Roseospirillum parvum]